MRKLRQLKSNVTSQADERRQADELRLTEVTLQRQRLRALVHVSQWIFCLRQTAAKH